MEFWCMIKWHIKMVLLQNSGERVAYSSTGEIWGGEDKFTPISPIYIHNLKTNERQKDINQNYKNTRRKQIRLFHIYSLYDIEDREVFLKQNKKFGSHKSTFKGSA